MEEERSELETVRSTPAGDERRGVRPWIRWLIVVFGMFLLVAIAVPNFVRARVTLSPNACLNNLRQIDAAKHQWALETGKDDSAVPTLDDIAPYLHPSRRRLLTCPASGSGGVFSNSYTIGALGESPKCEILPEQHFLPPD